MSCDLWFCINVYEWKTVCYLKRLTWPSSLITKFCVIFSYYLSQETVCASIFSCLMGSPLFLSSYPSPLSMPLQEILLHTTPHSLLEHLPASVHWVQRWETETREVRENLGSITYSEGGVWHAPSCGQVMMAARRWVWLEEESGAHWSLFFPQVISLQWGIFLLFVIIYLPCFVCSKVMPIFYMFKVMLMCLFFCVIFLNLFRIDVKTVVDLLGETGEFLFLTAFLNEI